MKKFRLIISVLLVLILTFSGVACKNDKGSEKDTSIQVNASSETYAKDAVTGAELMLVADRKSDYKIVLSAVAGNVEKDAAKELQTYLALSTKCTLPIITDSGITFDNKSKYISVGDTVIYKSFNIATTYAELGDSGFKILLGGNVIALKGATEEGTLYAVYEFLAKEIGFEAYAHDEIYYNKVSNVSVVNFGEYKSTAAVDYRLITFGDVRDVKESKVLRLPGSQSNGTSVYGLDWGLAAHSIDILVPYGTYGPKHPEWYWGGEICLSNDELIDTLVEALKLRILGSPSARFFELGHGDNAYQCGCDKCKQGAIDYGTSGGLFVVWLNKVGEKIEQWMQEENIDREIWIIGLAYHAYQYAPAVANGDGTYSPVNDSVVCRSNVGIRYAPINSCYAHAFDDPNCKVNQQTKVAEEVKKWSSCCDEKLFIWLYSAEFYDYMFYFNDLGALSGDYKFFKENGVYGIKDEAHIYNAHSPFAASKLYLRSKLAWDPSLDMHALYNDFMDNFFKAAAPMMKEYYEQIRAHFAELSIQLDSAGCYGFNKIGAYYMNPAYWGMDLLRRYQRLIDQAYEAIEQAGYDQETYEKVWWRIRLDEFFITHWYISTYSQYFSSQEYEAIKQAFYADCTALGIIGFSHLDPA